MKMQEPAGAGGVLLKEVAGKIYVRVVREDEDNPRHDKKAGMLGIVMGHKKKFFEPLRKTIYREFLEEDGRFIIVHCFLRDYIMKNGDVLSVYVVNENGKKERSEHEFEGFWMGAEELLNMPDEMVRYPTKQAIRDALVARAKK